MSSTGRADRLWALVGERAHRLGSTITPDVVCAVAAEALAVTGVSLTMVADPARWDAPTASDALAGQLDELQFTLGEGPGMDAMSSGGPVLVGELAERASQLRWPVFAGAATAAGAAALFVFPVRSGAIRVGLLALYRTAPGPLTAEQVADALVFAELALLVVLHAGQGVAPDAPGWHGDGLAGRQQVHQATGMVSVQLSVGLDEALVRLRAHAFSSDRALSEVAADVVGRRLRFDPDPT